jgi:hypothetical protein
VVQLRLQLQYIQTPIQTPIQTLMGLSGDLSIPAVPHSSGSADRTSSDRAAWCDTLKSKSAGVAGSVCRLVCLSLSLLSALLCSYV